MAKHIKILGIGDPVRLGDARIVESFLRDCVANVGMRPLDEPKIIDVPLQIEKLKSELFEDEGGITGQLVGYCTLSTSHIALHTWPLRRELHLDLYSCREYDKGELLTFVCEIFRLEKYKVSDLTDACNW